jgi:hypothetical protein
MQNLTLWTLIEGRRLLLTWHRLGAPPWFHVPLSPSFLSQGRALLTNLQ